MLTNADVDHVAGLLTLRERQAFNLYATARVLQVLESNTIFNVLDSRLVERISLPTDVRTGIVDTNGHSLGLEVDAFPIPGKIALYLEDPHSENMGSVDQDTIGIQVTDSTGGGRFFYLPGCASMPKELGERLKNAELVLMDGTTWIDDEMSQQGVGEKTARRMGHMAISGDSGTIRAFKDLNVARKVFVHINNTNPVLNEGSDEYKATLKAGWTVATDGLELTV